MPEEEVGALWEHVYSLRSHILWGGLFFIITASLVFSYGADIVIEYLLMPLKGEHLVFLSPLGPLFFKIRLSLYGALMLSSPIWIVLFLHFVFPALNKLQKIIASTFIFISAVLTIAALAGTYFYLVPIALRFLIGFLVPGTSFLLTADSYLSFVILQGIVAFVILQLPLVIILLAITKIVNPHTLATKRHFFYPALLVILAILTPTTDAITLAIVFIPAALLVEAGIIIGKIAYKRMQKL